MRPRRAPEFDHPHRRRHVAQQRLVGQRRVVRRVVAEVDTLRRGRVVRADEILVDLLRQERDDRGQRLRQRHQRLVEGRVGAGLVGVVAAAPEARATAPDVPVREVVHHERLRRPRRALRVEVGHPLGGLAHRLVQPRQDPAVERRALGDRHARCRGVEAVEPRVGHPERVAVPERQDEPPPHLVPEAVAEVEVRRGIAGHVEPAHHIDAHRLGAFLELDRVAPALVHLAALLVAQAGRSRGPS